MIYALLRLSERFRMRSPSGFYLSLTVLIIFVACTILSDIFPAPASTVKACSRILYINSYHRGYRWSDGIEKGLMEKLNGSGRNIELYIEYLDSQRFPDFEILPGIANIIARKHHRIVYDVIVVSDNDAVSFALKYRERIFPGVPIVFCGFNSFRPEYMEKVKKITGVNEEIDFKTTIDMALKVHPDTEKLVFITSDYYSTGKINQEKAEKELIPAYSDRYNVLQFKNLYLADLEHRLSRLADHTLVFVFGNPRDNYDREFVPSSEYYGRIAAASRFPAYSFWDFVLGTGITGGNIITGPDQGRRAAELALKILDGTPVEDLPFEMKSPSSMIFDFNAMQRFGIPEKLLPAGSRVINRPDSFYDKYRAYVHAGIVLFSLLIFIVIMLTILLRRSRILGMKLRAESEEKKKTATELEKHKEQLEDIVTERTAELRRTYESLHEREVLFHRMFDMHSAVMYLLNPDTGRIIEANHAALEFYGYTLPEMQELNIYSINPMNSDEINKKMQLTKRGEVKNYEFQHRIASGEIRDVEIYTSPIPYRGEELLFAVVHDITDRKMVENEREELIAELKEVLSEVRTLSGLLPICASCKKIRNDAGYWEQIEGYISRHSEAEFSHGLCPDCAAKLYPDLVKKKQEPSS